MNITDLATGIPQLDTKEKPNIWKAAQSLEANFLAEMLKSSGLGQSSSDFGGGAGEEQFSSFLTSEYATQTVAAGGIGLAESIYQSIVARGDRQ